MLKIKLVGFRSGIVTKEGKNKGKNYKVLNLLLEDVNDQSYTGDAVKEVFLMGESTEFVDASMVGEYIKIDVDKNFMTGYEEITGVSVVG